MYDLKMNILTEGTSLGHTNSLSNYRPAGEKQLFWLINFTEESLSGSHTDKANNTTQTRLSVIISWSSRHPVVAYFL